MAILVFRSENTNFVEGIEILLSIKFRQIPFRREVENVSGNQRPGRQSWFLKGPKNAKVLEVIGSSFGI